MSTQARRERERAEREQAIVAAARDLALAEGWDAVTTRRLAAEIEYSQPVLYSHFKGKDAIMAAVAVEGFAELANRTGLGPGLGRRPPAGGRRRRQPRTSRSPSSGPRSTTRCSPSPLTCRSPARTCQPTWPGASPSWPRRCAHSSADDDLEAVTETFWSGLHGLVTLMRSGRLRRADHDRRLAVLVDRFSR